MRIDLWAALFGYNEGRTESAEYTEGIRLKGRTNKIEPIDFVITWVDGSDPEWRRLKDEFAGERATNDAQSNDRERYEDWGLLKYWFRGIERFAPWVRRVHFVTWGHVPEWLNVDHPKLNIVRHADYIPNEYLPTFSSHPIELNLHRIEDLSEQFVYFNDDMFLIQKTDATDFFKDGLPCATAGLIPFRIAKGDGLYFPFNNVALINEHFAPRKSILAHFRKWFDPRYGLQINISSLLMLLFPTFYGFFEQHLPTSLLKSTFERVWSEEGDILSETSSHRFRNPRDVSPWLMENWQLVSGEFSPRSVKFGRAFYLGGDISTSLPELCDYIVHHKGKVVCVNDGNLSLDDAAHAKAEVGQAFSQILSVPSSFER